MNSLKNFAVAGLIAGALTLGATSATAATQVYKGYDANNSGNTSLASNPNATAASNAFNAQLSGTSTESFEGFSNGVSAPLGLTFTGSAGNLTANLTGSGQVQTATRAAPTGSGQYAIDGSRYYFIDGTNFTVTLGSPIAAFGFFATDLELAANINFTLNFTGGGSESYNLQDLFGTSGTLPSGSVHFLGFINTTNTFDSVVFSGNGASGDFLAFDLLTIGDERQVTGAVPEPATWAMMLGGFGAIGGSLRYRRRKSAVSFA